MARPLKEGLKYFPHDTDMSADDKMRRLEAKYGILGYGIYCKLLEKIYSSGGKFKIKNSEDFQYFSKIWHCKDSAELRSIIKSMISLELLDKDFLSNGIKKRIDTIKTERERKRKSYEKKKTDKGGDIDRKNYGETTEKLGETTQKEKEKEKEKEKDSVCNKHTEQTHEFLKQFKETEEYKKFKQYDLNYYDERINNYYAGQISGYEFWKKKIKLFIQNDEKEGKAVKPEPEKLMSLDEYIYYNVLLRFKKKLEETKNQSNGNFDEVKEADKILNTISAEDGYKKYKLKYSSMLRDVLITQIQTYVK